MSANAAFQKLINIMGAERARLISHEVMAQIGVRDLQTPNDRVRFGNALIGRGGVLESIGRSIKIQAILHGATEE